MPSDPWSSTEAARHSATAGETVYVGAAKRVWAASSTTGEEIWSQCAEGIRGVLLDGNWLFVLRDRRVIGLVARTGEPLWTEDLDDGLFFANAGEGILAMALAGHGTSIVAYGQLSD